MRKITFITMLVALTMYALFAGDAKKVKDKPETFSYWRRYLKRHPEADLNNDGIISKDEQERHMTATISKNLGVECEFKRVMMPMRDGTNLHTLIYIPKNRKGPLPVSLMRSGYVFYYVALNAAKNGGKNLKYQNVILVSQSLRGDTDSEGKGSFDAISFDNEINDSYDTVEWIAKQPWCDGRVGMTGGSGNGFTGYMALLSNPPHLKVINTNVSAGNSYLYWAFHNGVRREMYNWLVHRNISIPKWPKPTIRLFDRQKYDDFVDQCSKKTNAVFIARTGWYDIFAEGPLDYFAKFAKTGKVYLLVTPSGHGRMCKGLRYPNRGEKTAEKLFKMPEYLDVLKNPDMKLPESTMVYYLMGDCFDKKAPGNHFKTTNVWPVPNTPTPYYLHADGRVSNKAPKDKKGSLSFKYDPRDPIPSCGGDVFAHKGGVGPRDQRELKDRKDVLRFISEPLTEPLEITGKVWGELYFSSDAPDTMFTVKLIDVYPNGYEAMVRDSAMMARFRDGLNKPKKLEKGKVYNLKMDMWSTALVFNKGHRIAIHVSSSNSPKYEVHPNSYEPVNSFENAFVATNIIYMSKEHPSKVILPIVGRSSKD